ncbi:MAG: hypothetical protein IT210_26325 [Armatimonadetes bacterium]|nr:hypothetical protein [Armatimonadota bacterium]
MKNPRMLKNAKEQHYWERVVAMSLVLASIGAIGQGLFDGFQFPTFLYRILLFSVVFFIGMTIHLFKRDHSYEAHRRGLCYVTKLGPLYSRSFVPWERIENCYLDKIHELGELVPCLIVVRKDRRRHVLFYDPQDDALALDLCHYIRRKAVSGG